MTVIENQTINEELDKQMYFSIRDQELRKYIIDIYVKQPMSLDEDFWKYKRELYKEFSESFNDNSFDSYDPCIRKKYPRLADLNLVIYILNGFGNRSSPLDIKEFNIRFDYVKNGGYHCEKNT